LIELQYEFENKELFLSLCGIADANVLTLAALLDVELVPRGHSFLIRSEDHERLESARHFFSTLSDRYQSGETLPDRFDVNYLLAASKEGDLSESPEREGLPLLKEQVFKTFRGVPIYPKTVNQGRFVKSLFENDITFCTGPAGTGKTFLGIAVASRLLLKGDVERIILTRPAVEAGESLGFLPGDLTQKVDPYLRPVYDALYDCIGIERVYELIAARKIEIAPLAYMRGRTLNDSFILLDEAQNCTLPQIKMFLTRLGKHSKMCVGGDITQVDLSPGKSGLVKTVHLLRRISGIGVIELGFQDIVRNPLVEKIVQAFERGENEGESNRTESN